MPTSRTSFMVAVATVRTRRTFFRRVESYSRNAAARVACKRVRRQQGERCTVEHIAPMAN